MPRKSDWVDDKAAFDGMTRAQIAALSDSEREDRRERLRATPGVWTMAQLAAAGGLSTATIRRCRDNFLDGDTGDDALCEPDPDINSDNIRKPGDGRTGGGPSPVFRPRTGLAWLERTKRVDEDYVPFRRGRKPPGPAPRTPATKVA